MTAAVLGSGTPVSATSIQEPPAPPAHLETLTIRGSASSYVDVEIAESVVVHTGETRVSTEGQYAGFLILSLPDKSFKTGGVSVPAFDDTGHPFGPLTMSRPSVELEPGAYRVHLFAEAPAVVHTPLGGAVRSLRVRPSKPASVEAGVVSLTSEYAALHGRGAVAVDIQPGSRVLMATLQVTEHHQASRMAVCVADPGTPDCAALRDRGVGSDALYPAPSVSRSYFLTETGGTPQPGPADLLFSVDGVGLAETLLGFYLVIQPT